MTKFWIEDNNAIMTEFEGRPEQIVIRATASYGKDHKRTHRLRKFAMMQMALFCEAPTILHTIHERGKAMLVDGDGCQLCYGHYTQFEGEIIYAHAPNCQWPALVGALAKEQT